MQDNIWYALFVITSYTKIIKILQVYLVVALMLLFPESFFGKLYVINIRYVLNCHLCPLYVFNVAVAAVVTVLGSIELLHSDMEVFVFPVT